MTIIEDHPYIGKRIDYPGKRGIGVLHGRVVAVREYHGFEFDPETLRAGNAKNQIEVKIQPDDGGRCLWLGPLDDPRTKAELTN